MSSGHPSPEGLALLAQQRAPMPGVEAQQTVFVRYVASGNMTEGFWQRNEATRLGNEGRAGQGQRPPGSCLAVRFSISEAPAEWAWPIRMSKCFRPGFKVCIEVVHETSLALPVSLQASLLGEEEQANLVASLRGAPATSQATSDKPRSQAVTALLAGTTSRSAIIEAGKAGSTVQLPASTSNQQTDGVWPPSTAVGAMLSREEFAFSDLKFCKPSRVQPVYIAFTCTLLATGDQLTVLYNIPTVCTCRAEQWQPACARLGVPDDLHGDSAPTTPTLTNPSLSHLSQPPSDGGEPAGAAARLSLPTLDTDSVPSRPRGLMERAPSVTQELPQQRRAASSSGSGGRSGGRTVSGGSNGLCQSLAQVPLPAVGLVEPMHVVEWCAEAFACLDFTRSLTHEDLQHSWELFHTFRTHYLSCLTFLRRIASLWNKQSPTIVAGFAVNRDVSVQRLQPQPVGTFLCRLSCSRAGGGMALAVRVGPEHPHAGADQVLHVLITAADIQHKDVQTLLRDYTGTKYVLDVYTGKRMDKRKVFAGDYMRLGDIVRLTKQLGCSCQVSSGGTARGSQASQSVADGRPSPSMSAQPSTTPSGTSSDRASQPSPQPARASPAPHDTAASTPNKRRAADGAPSDTPSAVRQHIASPLSATGLPLHAEPITELTAAAVLPVVMVPVVGAVPGLAGLPPAPATGGYADTQMMHTADFMSSETLLPTTNQLLQQEYSLRHTGEDMTVQPLVAVPPPLPARVVALPEALQAQSPQHAQHVSGAMLDSAQLDIATLLDTGPVNCRWDQETHRSQLNTGERLMAAMLLGTDDAIQSL